MELEVGDIVLCIVERVEKTIVFVKIPFGNKELDGSIITSEIAPGRIRNLRDYVVPKKKIVCKVLRVSKENYELSLRRVTVKEQKEILEQEKQEKSYVSVLRSVLKEKLEKILGEINRKKKLFDFVEDAKKDSSDLEEIVGKEDSKKIMEILMTQKQKKSILKKKISLKSERENGIELIKDILGDIKDAKVKYIAAGVYSIEAESESIKKADQKIQEILKVIKEKSEKVGANFSVN
jgi:translation initiation factor 2 alpha subunit (eIF-2alpha)